MRLFVSHLTDLSLINHLFIYRAIIAHQKEAIYEYFWDLKFSLNLVNMACTVLI